MPPDWYKMQGNIYLTMYATMILNAASKLNDFSQLQAHAYVLKVIIQSSC